MAKFKNISPLGDLFIPALNAQVLSGESIEVTDEEVIGHFRDQAETWKEVSGDSKKSTSTPDAAPAAE